MRADMDKVLVERPRHGKGWERKGRAVKPQDQPAFDCLQNASRSGRGSKSLNENLAPLRRYLGRQVGRPWNKVFSEMRQRIKPGNTVQEHILVHVDGFIAVQAEKVAATEQTPCAIARKPNGRDWGRWSALQEGELYVDPDDDIIKRAKRRWRPARRDAPPGGAARRLDDGGTAVKIDGLWYQVAFARYVLGSHRTSHGRTLRYFALEGAQRMIWDDPLFGRMSPDSDTDIARMAEAYGHGRLVVGKRQLSRGELRYHALVNG